MTMCFIGNVGKKTWQIVAICQIRQRFLPAKVLFYTVFIVCAVQAPQASIYMHVVVHFTMPTKLHMYLCMHVVEMIT